MAVDVTLCVGWEHDVWRSMLRQSPLWPCKLRQTIARTRTQLGEWQLSCLDGPRSHIHLLISVKCAAKPLGSAEARRHHWNVSREQA